MDVRFKKLKPTRAFQAVVDQIQEAIISGDIKPGDTLPPEMKLKEMFNTSRGTVREALRVLEQKGLVDIKTGAGGGAVVKEAEPYKITETLGLLIQLNKVSYYDLAEFREGVEGLVAALAAQRVDERGARELQDIISKAEAVVKEPDPDVDEFAELDVKFHIAVAEIAGNNVYTAVLQMVHENILSVSDKYLLTGEMRLKESFEDLVHIAAAVIEGDSELAKSLSEAHVARFVNTFVG